MLEPDSPPTLLLSRRTRRHAVLFGLGGRALVVMGIYLLVAIVVTASLSSLTVAGLAALVGLGLYAAVRQPLSIERDPWGVRLVQTWRLRQATRTGVDAFRPSQHTPVPRPVGDILILGVARTQDSPEQVLIRHSTSARGVYFSATIEIEGRGDGLRPTSAARRDDAALERALNTLAEDRSPIDELSLMTRAMPGLPDAYKERVRAMRDPSLDATMLGDNIEQRMANVGAVSDKYRMFATLSMPEEALHRWAARRLGATDRDAISQAAYSQLGLVAELLNTAGFRVVQGLGPRRFGALVRHLYMPSRSMDDLSGIAVAHDGFPSYPRPLYDALQVPDWRHDVLWYHATGTIAPSGWPAGRVTSRWMLPAVGQMFDVAGPSAIRTVTSTWRLLSRRESQREMADQILNTMTQVVRDQGRVTTGEDQEQVDLGHQVMSDLRHQSSGVLPSVRVTCSAPSALGIMEARGLVDSSMSDMNVDAFRWHDGRQADAMVLSLPLGRGLAR